MNIRSIDVIVGGQFGSEAKGHVTKRVILHNRLISNGGAWDHVNVRVAGPNAGHSVIDKNGNKLALRQIPVGVVIPDVYLLIAPGSEVNMAVLADEVARVKQAGHDVWGRLYIHEEATLLHQGHIIAETGMHEAIGSTGKGIGAARVDRIMRRGERVKDNPEAVNWLNSEGINVIDDDNMYGIYNQRRVVIEGTQGYGLGLHAGYYPQCTSSDCRPVDFLAMSGLDPTFTNEYHPWVVARVFPIRVAGNSGPLKDETSWEELGLPEELTTVTQKVRRVGGWDADLVNRAIRSAGPQAQVAITMFDQIVPQVTGMDSSMNASLLLAWHEHGSDRFRALASSLDAPVRLVTTGPDTGVWL